MQLSETGFERHVEQSVIPDLCEQYGNNPTQYKFSGPHWRMENHEPLMLFFLTRRMPVLTVHEDSWREKILFGKNHRYTVKVAHPNGYLGREEMIYGSHQVFQGVIPVSSDLSSDTRKVSSVYQAVNSRIEPTFVDVNKLADRSFFSFRGLVKKLPFWHRFNMHISFYAYWNSLGVNFWQSGELMLTIDGHLQEQNKDS